MNAKEFDKELQKIAELKDNWDNYGAVAVHPEILKTAKLFRNTNTIIDVYPNPHGTISIDSRASCGTELLIEIGLNGLTIVPDIKKKKVVNQDPRPSREHHPQYAPVSPTWREKFEAWKKGLFKL